MKNLLSTALFGVIFLGLAALAFLSAPRGASEVAASTAPETTSAVVAGSAPNALLATDKYNFVSLPLDSTASISPFTASGLATYIGASAKAILRWNPATQGFVIHTVGSPFNNYALETSGSYLVAVDASADPVLTFVGDVPAMGSTSFALTQGASPTDCKYNSISIPLDQSGITNASGLATSITGVKEVLAWNAVTQGFIIHTVGSPFNNFSTSIGYPYLVCVTSVGPISWP